MKFIALGWNLPWIKYFVVLQSDRIIPKIFQFFLCLKVFVGYHQY